jgi:hypothetical protein
MFVSFCLCLLFLFSRRGSADRDDPWPSLPFSFRLRRPSFLHFLAGQAPYFFETALFLLMGTICTDYDYFAMEFWGKPKKKLYKDVRSSYNAAPLRVGAGVVWTTC